MVKPSKITDEITDICIENIKLGMSYNACAKSIGITYQTWNNWVKWGQEGKTPYAKWYIAIQAAEAALLKDCLLKIRKSADLGNIESVKWLLERRFGEFAKQNSLNVKAQVESVNVNVNPQLNYDENEKIRQKILEKLSRPSRVDPRTIEEHEA